MIEYGWKAIEARGVTDEDLNRSTQENLLGDGEGIGITRYRALDEGWVVTWSYSWTGPADAAAVDEEGLIALLANLVPIVGDVIRTGRRLAADNEVWQMYDLDPDSLRATALVRSAGWSEEQAESRYRRVQEQRAKIRAARSA